MYKRFFFAIVVALCSQINAQPAPQAQVPLKEEKEIFKRHEIKLDIFYAMLSTLKFGYEYVLDYHNALALTMHYDFSKEPEIKIQALASYKLYLFKIISGPNFFVESSMGYTRGYNEYWNHRYHEQIYNSFTIGLSSGIKFYLPEMHTGLEVITGISRPYGRDYYDDNDSIEMLPMFSINLIRRF
jgi:hypothetical protein